MIPHPFEYYRAASLEEASRMLGQLGEDAKVLAGGQSLIPLMKLRLARPSALVDLNHIPRTAYIEAQNGDLRIGAMTRHAEIEDSPAAARIAILHDCAAGIADPQVRNMGTIGGSVAEADPHGDWAPVLIALGAEVESIGPAGARSVPIAQFIKDAFTTVLGPTELVREIRVPTPGARSAGAYIAFKRCAPVYPTASAAVQVTMLDDDFCQDAKVVLGSVGLTPVIATEAAAALRGQAITPHAIERAAEAAMAAADPQADVRGSVDYKRLLVQVLTRRALLAALARARGEKVEVSHEYVGR
ncbi:MAG TPA: xanthine dehydrogenase family protein subunit M [Candidatus Acidoferrales bacterium]|nr:xanthine dehydrogenase family protein subunit M [Candidatus Acidoferrales bacterium]